MIKKKNFYWLLQMALRDSRRSKSRLFLFISSIILGIAALVAINSFKENLNDDIDDQAKELLGADLVIGSNRPFEGEMQKLIDSLGGEQALEISFASMIQFPKNEGTRLVNVRALQGRFPFYGELETIPPDINRRFQEEKNALVDKTLMLQYDIEPGDSIKVGQTTFHIAGQIEKLVGRPGISSNISPPVYIPYQYLDETGLVQKGSRINYRNYFKFEVSRDVNQLVETLEERLEKESVWFDTVDSRKGNYGKTFGNLTGFLNLVAFVALLLGCIGVASSVHIYVRDKINSVAILRCLGAKGYQSFSIFLIQILVMGLMGSTIGALFGSIIQYFLPELFAEFLPVSVSNDISWQAIVVGVFTGLGISILFALIPLLTIRNISPLRTLRASFEGDVSAGDPYKIMVYTLIGLFIFGFSYWQIQDPLDALIFTASIAGAFLLLAGLAKGIIWLAKKYFPDHWNYIGRQGLANLYRPNNQTIILIVSIGLGTALLATLFFVQDLLLDEVAFSSKEGQPNMVLFDIQSDQRKEVKSLTEEYGMPVLQEVPVVTMRLLEIDGISKREALEDSTLDIPDWAYDREYRVTYRDTLIDSEEAVAGKWPPVKGDSIFISVEKGFAERIGLEMGDEMYFNIQGAYLKTYIGHLREVEWNRVQTNFLVIFPSGVLEKAPQFHVIMTRADTKEQSANFQKALVSDHPNVSAIDLALILTTVEEVLDKVAFVIRFMAAFSIITGVLVLISSVLISKFQRIQESVLLRTLGANRQQIILINALEYLFLGTLASLAGILLALAGSWGLAYFNFDTDFSPTVLPVILVFVFITTITVLIGMFNIRPVLSRPPLEILRAEV